MIEELKALRDSLGLDGVRIAALASGYPSPAQPYGGGVFHSLARIYKELFPLLLLVPIKDKKREYEYEEVKVRCVPPPEAMNQLRDLNPDILLLLSVCSPLLVIASFIQQNTHIPMIIFPIGSDAIYTPIYRPIESLRKIPKKKHLLLNL